MKAKGQVALAVGAGYMLGRTHKMKAALMLAAAGATGRYPGGPRDLLQRGARVLADSPEVARLGESIRGELMQAARAAAVTAASQRIDSFSDRLRARPEEIVGDVTDTVRKTSRRAADVADEDEEEYADEEPEDELAEEDASAEEEDASAEDSTEDRSARRRPVARRRESGNGSSEPTEDDGSTRRKTRASAPSKSAPVRRTRK